MRSNSLTRFGGIFALTLGVALLLSGSLWGLDIPAEVQALRKRGTCSACHMIDAKLVGPSFRDIVKKYQGQDVLKELTRKAKQGGKGVWGEVPMPPNTILTEAEIGVVVEWILSLDPNGEPVDESSGTPSRPATPQDIIDGQKMFQGYMPFKNGGPTCNSCHHVKNDAVIGGGVLAAELTSAFATLNGADGIRGVLEGLPFPVMKQAYDGKELAPEEVFALIAFLEDANANQASQQPQYFGIKLFLSGIVGMFLLLGIYSVLWRNRRRASVYQEIFDRQIKSQ